MSTCDGSVSIQQTLQKAQQTQELSAVEKETAQTSYISTFEHLFSLVLLHQDKALENS